jgi:hypothetical protein
MSREQPDLGTLINLVEKYPFLFDKQNKHFKNARMREQAWDEIGRTLSTEVDECQRLWRNLRDRYSREKRRKPSGSQAADEPQWVYFDNLHFLDKVIRPRKTYSNVSGGNSGSSNNPLNSMSHLIVNDSQGSRESDGEDVSDVISETPTSDNGDNTESRSRYVISPEPTPTRNQRHLTSDNTERTQQVPTGRTGKGKQAPSNQMLSEIVSTARTIGSHFQNRVRLTADEIFGQYIGARLSEMEESPKKKKLKRELLSLLEQDD